MNTVWDNISHQVIWIFEFAVVFTLLQWGWREYKKWRDEDDND